MKKFIFKVLLFTTPFLFLFTITKLLYSETEEPDLLRLGYIPNIYINYRDVFTQSESENFSKLSQAKMKKYKIMNIGDSFSEKGGKGYKNFIAKKYSVLHIDRFISKNQIQTLIDMCNGDFFDHYTIEYIVLQSVVRQLIDDIENVDMNGKITISDLDSIIVAHKTEKKSYKYDFFSRQTIEFPLYYIPKFFFLNDYLSNGQVYNYDLNTNKLFSIYSDRLLFYHKDITSVSKNNDDNNCERLNTVLNTISKKLKDKNIKLIFLPSADKYDLYYNFIIDRKELPKPLFFDKFKKLKKEYIYIDSKAILSNYLNKQKDLYYYDDTHWSPIASNIIANNIINQIE